jgi:5-methylcytosine-specific restriction endonuclease McrA
MSEDEACRRIHAARLARRFPDLLVRIERGDLTLSTIALLHDALTEATYEDLVEAATGKTKSEVQAIVAKRWPASDVPAAITTIPTQAAIPTLGTLGVPAVAAPATSTGPQLSPLSQTRHKVQFTASDALRKKLERAQDLMRHANVEGDLAVVVERAVDLLLDRLEKQRLGKTSRRRRSPGQARQRSPEQSSERSDVSLVTRASRTKRVSRATRRAVFVRDGERCTFTDAKGLRCPATTWLELDHVIARARGGTDEVGNLRVRCRAHNALHAERTFGKEHVERKIHERRHRDPRQRGSASESRGGAVPETCDRAVSGSCDRAAKGLTNLGFHRSEVGRALGCVRARHPGEDLSAIPVQTLLREALAFLAH